jgi:hypothetical protein
MYFGGGVGEWKSCGFWRTFEKNHMLVGKYRKIIQSPALTH